MMQRQVIPIFLVCGLLAILTIVAMSTKRSDHASSNIRQTTQQKTTGTSVSTRNQSSSGQDLKGDRRSLTKFLNVISHFGHPVADVSWSPRVRRSYVAYDMRDHMIPSASGYDLMQDHGGCHDMHHHHMPMASPSCCRPSVASVKLMLTPPHQHMMPHMMPMPIPMPMPMPMPTMAPTAAPGMNAMNLLTQRLFWMALG